MKITCTQRDGLELVIDDIREDFTLKEFIKLVIVPMLLAIGYDYEEVKERLIERNP